MKIGIFDRYVPRELAPDDRGRVLWGIWDEVIGGFVWTDGELEAHTLRGGAEGWIRRQVYLDQVKPSGTG